MINVGIIGLGFMGYTHFNIYKAHRRARVVAIGDKQKKRLEGRWGDIGGNVGDKTRVTENLTGIGAYSDWRDLVADPKVDLVDICLGTHLHREVAVAALRAGKHVLLEKPMAANSRDARVIRNAAARAKGMFMVGHCVRFWPENEKTQRLIHSGKYGRVREVFMRRMTTPPAWGDEGWFMNAAKSGGALMDLHIHDLDWVRYLLGDPVRIQAWGEAGPSGLPDVVHAGLDYGGGVRATVIGGWIYHRTLPFLKEFCIRCEGGTFFYSNATGRPLTIYTDRRAVTPKIPAGTGWARQIDYFIRCIETGKTPEVVTAESSLASIELVEKELKSIHMGRPVRV
jgi:predicted dehydrogenase